MFPPNRFAASLCLKPPDMKYLQSRFLLPLVGLGFLAFTLVSPQLRADDPVAVPASAPLATEAPLSEAAYYSVNASARGLGRADSTE